MSLAAIYTLIFLYTLEAGTYRHFDVEILLNTHSVDVKMSRGNTA
jgi:hypothetical protein